KLEINHSETKNDLQSRSSISHVDVSTENNLSHWHVRSPVLEVTTKTISDYGGYRKSSYQEKVSKSSPEISHVYTPPEENSKDLLRRNDSSMSFSTSSPFDDGSSSTDRIVPIKLKQTPSKKKSKEIKS
ncbi:hypothetical protein RhiirA1_411722, partial [Rhizophagus irregularis]